MSDPYEVLELPNTATEKDIRKQYLRLARIYHPDKVEDPQKAQAEEKFREISVAYETLTQPADSTSRAGYSRSSAYSDPFSLFDELVSQMRSSTAFFNDPFFNDPFFNRQPSMHRSDPFAGFMGGDMMGFPSMMGGMGGLSSMGGFSGMSSMSSMSGMPAMTSGRSISTSIVNGRKEVKETTRNPDGSTHIKITTPEGVHESTQQAQLPQANHHSRSNYHALPSSYNRFW